MLKPELQGMDSFAEGMENIVATQKRVAEHYFSDGSIVWACPPIKALLHIMRDGHYEGKTFDAPEIRTLFTRESVLASDWYRARLRAKQGIDARLWERHVDYLEKFLASPSYAGVAGRMGIKDRLAKARLKLAEVHSAAYVDHLVGMTGVEAALPEVMA